MAETNDIRCKFFDEGKNVTTIARETGYDRKTVRKYIHRDDWNEALVDDSRPSKLDPYKPLIDRWLENDKHQRRKQRHTARRVFKRLQDEAEDFDSSYRTVCTYVGEARRRLYQERRGFLPLQHIPGEAQVDFGEADFIENGRRVQGSYLTLSLPHSNGGFLQVFGGQTYECLAAGMKSIFEHMGGVPSRIWFDNASSMVANIGQDGERKMTESFARFVNHYGFEAVFCNKGAGNEKGSVENKVGYLRRNYLVPIPEFTDIREFNNQMLQTCQADMERIHYRKKQLISLLFEEDRQSFSELPSLPLDIRSEQSVRVDAYGKVTLFGRHRYSTVPRLAKSRAVVVLRAHEVTILDENFREVARHRRLFGEKEQEAMDWIPYLKQLSRYPAALKYSGIHAMLPDPVKDFLENRTRRERGETLRVLSELTDRSDFPTAVQALRQSLDLGRSSPDDIRALHARYTDGWAGIEQIRVSAQIPHLDPIRIDTESYDQMLIYGESR